MKSRPNHEAPGNRLGALGMFASLAGGWALIPEVPSVPVSWTTSGQALLILGVALALFGLHYEWRGARRWSALLPGLALLFFTLTISGFAVARAAGQRVESLEIGATEVDARVPNGRETVAAAFVVHASEEDGDLLIRLSDALAREGVLSVPMRLDGLDVGTVAAVRQRAGREAPVGIFAFGEAGLALESLDALPIDFLVLGSATAPPAASLPAEGPSLLAIYGFDDEVINPNEHGRRLMGVFAESGRARQNVQMFLGADHQLRRSEQPGFLPAGFAVNMVALLAGWMTGGGFSNSG